MRPGRAMAAATSKRKGSALLEDKYVDFSGACILFTGSLYSARLPNAPRDADGGAFARREKSRYDHKFSRVFDACEYCGVRS